MENRKKAEVQIEIDEITAQGTYSNLAMIGHSENEFIIDFIFIQPQSAKAKVRNRIITSPSHAKQLVAALQENIARYEERFGPIRSAAAAEDKKTGIYH